MATELKDAVETSPKLPKVTPEMVIKSMASKVKFSDNPIKKEAINVYKNRWRVNIWTTGNNNARVEQSWFVLVDSNGEVVSYN
jgi:hypothetical protein